jgi:phosphatidylglycerol:prolipoprotein diacylglycerol transferase
MLVHPQIDPIAFSIGPLAVRWYGLMYLAGFAAGWWLGVRRIAAGAAPVTRRQFDDLLFLAVLGVILGGRLGYVLFYKPAHYLANPLEIFAVWQGGMSFHGGLLGVMAAMSFAAWRHRIDYLRLMDFVAPLCPLGIAAGRMGNFINGELWAASPTCPGAWCFAALAMRRDIPRSSTSSRSRASCSSSSCGCTRASRGHAARCRRCSSSATACSASSRNSGASPTPSSAISPWG